VRKGERREGIEMRDMRERRGDERRRDIQPLPGEHDPLLLQLFPLDAAGQHLVDAHLAGQYGGELPQHERTMHHFRKLPSFVLILA